MLYLSFLQKLIIIIIPLLFAITIHEVAHGWVALKCGDKTAQMLGRLTLNPLKHIDIIGTLIIPFLLFWLGGFVFGWAKPVPINPRNLHYPRRDLALISIAGPLANLLMAIFWAGILKLGLVLSHMGWQDAFPVMLMGEAGITINLGFALLNLIPLPPLDGGHLVSNLLPPYLGYRFNRIERYGFIILLLLIGTGALNSIFQPTVIFLHHLIIKIFGL
jgi:Zn-dependent protease